MVFKFKNCVFLQPDGKEMCVLVAVSVVSMTFKVFSVNEKNKALQLESYST